MNQKIEKTLRESILSAREYVANKTIRDSIEEWKEFWLRQTRQMEEQNDPANAWAIENNYSFIEGSYDEFISALENEKQYRTIIKNILKKFDDLDEATNIDHFTRQLSTELPKLNLRPDADSLYGIFFEYDSGPVFGVTCFPRQPFEIIIEEPKYVTYENGAYASDVIIEIDFAQIGQPVFNDEFVEMNDLFDRLEIFNNIIKMHINYSYLCLHHALKRPDITRIMDQTPIDPKALFFAMQHDCEHRTIFVRK